MVGCNLEQFRWVLQSVDFIQHDPLATQTAQEVLWVKHRSANARQFAVEILRVRQVLTQTGFANPADASQPDNGSLFPGPVEQIQPEMQEWCHLTFGSFALELWQETVV